MRKEPEIKSQSVLLSSDDIFHIIRSLPSISIPLERRKKIISRKVKEEIIRRESHSRMKGENRSRTIDHYGYKTERENRCGTD